MKLFIDTTNSTQITIGLDAKKFTTESHKEKSQALLGFIVDTLAAEKLTLADVSAIEINPGPGSFTGLRVGLAVASTLASQLGVKLNGKDVGNGEQVELVYDN